MEICYGKGAEMCVKAFSHYDGEDHLLRIIDDSGNEWDEDLSDWYLIFDLTTERSFWRNMQDGREIDCAYEF